MDLNEYLDSLGLEKEERGTLATILAKAGDKATAPMLMRADYTRKTQELAKERERISNENAQMNQQYSAALKELEAGKVSLAQYQAKIERLGTEWGLPEDQWKAPVTTTQQEPGKQVPQDPLILQRLENAERNYGIAPEVGAILQELQIEYQDVFGNLNGFSPTGLLKYSRENSDPKRGVFVPLRGERDESGKLIGAPGAFERLYKIADKRHERLVADITAKATKEAEEKVQLRIDQITAGNATGERNPNNWGQNGSHLLSKPFQDSQAERVKNNGGDPKVLDRAPSQSRSAAQGEMEGGAANFAKRFIERRAKGVGYGAEEKVA